MVKWTWLLFLLKHLKSPPSQPTHLLARCLNQTLYLWWPNLFHVTSFWFVGLFANICFSVPFDFFPCMLQMSPMVFSRMGPLLSTQPSWAATRGQWHCSLKLELTRAWGTRYILEHRPSCGASGENRAMEPCVPWRRWQPMFLCWSLVASRSSPEAPSLGPCVSVYSHL